MKEVEFNKVDPINYDYINEIQNKIINKDSINEKEVSYYLDCIISYVRDKIYDEEHPYFEFKCDLAQSIICYYLDDIGVVNYPCSTIKTIYSSVSGHNFVVATFIVSGKETNYLIDPTYIQFFKRENCNDEKYVTVNEFVVKTPDPGYFVSKNDYAKIMMFNYYGFDILDDDLARIYGNSFYNTRTMKTDRKFDSLSGDYYINSFLKNGHEKLSKTREELINDGYYIDFSKRKVK